MALCPILLTACGTVAAPAQSATKITLSQAEQAAVVAGVKESLKDPYSAKFHGMLAVRGANGVIKVCGRVNAKNSFGGYTGMQPYIGVLTSAGRFVVIGMGGTDVDTRVVHIMCAREGIT